MRTPSQLYHQGDVKVLVHQVHDPALIRLPIDNSRKMIYASVTLPAMLPKLFPPAFDDEVLPCRGSLYTRTVKFCKKMLLLCNRFGAAFHERVEARIRA